MFKAAEFFILIGRGFFLPLRAEIRSATPSPLLFTPIPAKINNPFTSFISPIAPLPLIYLAQTRFPSLAKAKGMGNQVKRLCIFIESRVVESCREGTSIAALSLYRAKQDRILELHRGENLFSPLLSSLWFFLFSHALSLPVFL